MYEFLERLGIREHNPGGCCGINEWMGEGDTIASVNPATGATIATVGLVSEDEYDTIASAAQAAFHSWRMVPGPVRGTIVRDIGLKLEERKEDLARLVALEMGKILEEARGEVQEAIDMAVFASGLSRQLYGKTMASERPEHRLYEQWHPLGPVGIITAFNFPVAVWSWNALVATTCGDTTLWKPSSKVPLCAIAVQRIVNEVLAEHGWERGVACLACGSGKTVGTWLTQDERVPLVSATGSVAMGRRVSENVSNRLGRTILELGGNNAVIVGESADLEQAVPAIVFGAIGTAGQRCTSIRRLIVHESVKESLVARLIKAYSSLAIGDPLDPKTRMGPLIDADAVGKMQMALESARDQGGTILYGGRKRGETFVDPAIVEVPGNVPIVAEETFAPILYVMAYEDFEEALWLHNDVPQGLSSSLFSTDLREAETFLSHKGSDCGIANVNVSTSGAEIGAAFGGEKDTGGGREAGSDAWKAYMRRQSVTINWGAGMPLSQGIDFSY
jgi:aldehyde dehydrogenase (NAD+)